ncbi:hypothetical protein CYMTET_15491 [Cymbomonas tetramitiformis]|nr:hypothetical protein CYMTET_15491 [Cymbomonas tetramitiformis]
MKVYGCFCVNETLEFLQGGHLLVPERFHTIALQDIPVFNADNRPTAYRFVTLIDVMYENKTRLLCSAQGDPAALFESIMTQEQARDRQWAQELIVDDNLGFTKDRVISRLTEMQSEEYARAHAEKHAPEFLAALRQNAQHG